MTCHEAQKYLSLYWYGELEFAEEEQFEQHVSECAACRRALASEKAWHATVNAERVDVPLELLGECRRELRSAVRSRHAAHTRWWERWGARVPFSSPRWSLEIALASFLVFVGFGAARYIDRNGLPGGVWPETQGAGLVNPSAAKIRDIEPTEDNHVRIVFEQERAITGPADSDEIREWLLAATTAAEDPGIRIDSVEMLKGQLGRDVEDALLNTVRNDENAAVRLKAVEGLRRFRDDAPVREALVYVLQHDENAGVRAQAVDVLAPATRTARISPGLADALQAVVRSGQPDDYVRQRCFEVLRDANAPLDVY
jgi:HEAT repeats/Putative zinc-finger